MENYQSNTVPKSKKPCQYSLPAWLKASQKKMKINKNK